MTTATAPAADLTWSEYSHHAIYKIDNGNKRVITVVYRCQSCRNEIFEEGHLFECVAADTCEAECNFVRE
jgi:hypothetical protein